MPGRKISLLLCSFAVFSSFGLPNPALAQTRFIPAAERQDFNDYDFVEKCLVAFGKVYSREIVKLGVRRDTMAFESSELFAPLPDATIEFANECSARWKSIPQPALEKDTAYYDIMKLFLYANRREEVHGAMEKLIEARSQVNDTVFIYSWGATATLLSLYRPISYDLLDLLTSETIERHQRMTAISDMLWWYSFNWYQLLSSYDVGGKTDQATMLATKMVELNDRLSEEDKTQINWVSTNGPLLTFRALEYLNRSRLLDSLKESTPAYLGLRNSFLDHAMGGQVGTLVSLIGRRAPVLRHDFYFKGLETRNIPLSDNIGKKTTMVVFLGHHCHHSVPAWRSGPSKSSRGCYDTYATIRRLHKEFQDVPIIIATQTRGFFGALSPPAPEEEAQKLKELWLDFHKLPADLAVENTDHWFLPGYDKRRIDELTDNYKNYSLNGSFKVGETTLFLLDEEGIIIHSGNLERVSAATQVAPILRALAARGDQAQ